MADVLGADKSALHIIQRNIAQSEATERVKRAMIWLSEQTHNLTRSVTTNIPREMPEEIGKELIGGFHAFRLPDGTLLSDIIFSLGFRGSFGASHGRDDIMRLRYVNHNDHGADEIRFDWKAISSVKLSDYE